MTSPPVCDRGVPSGSGARLIVFCPWADRLEDASAFLQRLPQGDLSSRLPAGADESLRRMARLDCDWFGECVRCFAALGPPTGTLPAWVVGAAGMRTFVTAAAQKPAGERWWWIMIGQHPQQLAGALGTLAGFLRRSGVNILLYAFDEVSRFMPCFHDLAPHLSVLIHDESPLDPAGERLLAPDCIRVHQSWVANVVPFAAPFNPAPEARIVFLGSQLGLTAHRKRQIAFLHARFKDRFTAIHDHSLPVGRRFALNRHAVSFCPEGRKFTTPAMARTHTDRPFWSGCLGMVPVAEDSQSGGRLDALANAGLILRYPHGDLRALAECCERALATTPAERSRIYAHFNQHETVGPVVAAAIAGMK
jgi:hypothetical protein